MRITEVVANFPPYFGGIGNSCLRMSVGLMKQNNQVEVYTSLYPKVNYKYPTGLKVNRLKYQFKYGNAPLTLGLLKIKNTDVIHLHYPYYFGAELVYLLSKTRKIPYVITYHMDMVGNGFLKHIFSLHRKVLLKVLMNGATRIYVSSYDYARSSDLANIESIQNKIVEIPLGVDTDRFYPITPSPRILNKLKIKPNEQIIMFIGQLDRPHYSKGVPLLLEAFSKIRQADVKLVIVGGGDLQHSFEVQAQDLNIKDQVIFTGSVDNDLLNEYLSITRFTVLPSSEESFGMVLLESQSAGKCVIASDLPGVRTVVRNNEDGLLVNVNDVEDLRNKMQKLLDNPDLTQQLGASGREKIENYYTWDRVNQLLSEDINKSIANGIINA